MSFTEEQKAKRIISLRGIILSRWFLILGLGIVGVIQRLAGVGVTSLTIDRLIVLVILPIIYNLGFSIYIRKPNATLSDRSLKLISLLQIVVDQLMITFLIYYTGGVESVTFIVYLFPLLAATILFSDIEIIFLSLLTIGIYTGIITLEYHGFIAHFARYHHDSGIYRNFDATLLNTMTIDLLILLLALLAAFVNRILHDRELDITIERDKVRSILNSLEEGIIMIDTQKRVLSLNPPALALLRLYDDFSKPMLEKADFPKSFSGLLDVILSQPNKKELGHEVTVTEGDTKSYFRVDSIPILGTTGEVLSWVKVVKDITREKELDQVKSDFISVAAHQLRTPLAGLKWFFRIMSDGDAGTVTKKQAELLEQAYQKSNQIIDIVNNLLDVSEIEEGHSKYAFTEEDVIKIVEEVVQLTRDDAQRKKINLVYHIPVGKNPPISVDKPKIRMAIQNLVDNAIKYSPENSTVTITVEYKHDRCLMSIQDQGIGISKKEQSKIFSKFFRATNAKEKESNGSGLGLYIVKNLIQKHRGQIWFESKVNHGTTFYISLPVPRKYVS